jgi:hypothetical protein
MPGKIAYAMVSIMLLAPIKLAKASSSYLSPLRQRYPVGRRHAIGRLLLVPHNHAFLGILWTGLQECGP